MGNCRIICQFDCLMNGQPGNPDTARSPAATICCYSSLVRPICRSTCDVEIDPSRRASLGIQQSLCPALLWRETQVPVVIVEEIPLLMLNSAHIFSRPSYTFADGHVNTEQHSEQVPDNLGACKCILRMYFFNVTNKN